MKKLFLAIFLMSSFGAFAQDYLTVPSSNPSLFYRQTAKSQDKVEQYKSFIYLFDTLSLPFKDDFSRDKMRKLNAKEGDAGLQDTVFYYLYLGNVVSDTGARYSELRTNTYRFNADSSAIDTTPNPQIAVTFNDYSVYPNESVIRQVYPAYNIYDTVGKPVDTIASAFTYEQDSVIRYIVPADGKEYLWQNDFVLINDGFAFHPPSYGVATFDGLDRFGRAYDISSTNTYGVADVLTSAPIDLSGLTLADSVFLSFQYQPQGLGRDAPEPNDSLVLDFYDVSQKKWKTVWGARGSGRIPFEKEILLVDSAFLEKGFQFRFKNKGNLSGAYDNWNIDYIYLNKQRSRFDIVFDDVAILSNYPSMLKDYSSIPYWQYAAIAGATLRDTISNFFGNNTTNTKTVYFRYFVSDPSGTYYPQFPFPSNTSTTTTLPGLGTQRRNYPLKNGPLNFEYPITDMDTAHSFLTTFVAQFSNSGGQDFFPENDTLFHEQRFDHYLAYDDGSAEAGYGVNITDTTFGKRGVVAQRFTTFIQDTLTAVSIYFLQQGVDLEGSTFNLCVWSDLNQNGLIYKKPMKDVVSYFDKNGFRTYHLDDSVIVEVGDFYIGIEQSTFRSLNVGYDFSNDRKNSMFYSLDGGVTFSTPSGAIQPGTMMLRPYFRINKNQVAVEENELKALDVMVYPNPTSGGLLLRMSEGNSSLMNYQVYDIQGRLILQNQFIQQHEIDLSDQNNGVYLLRLMDQEGQSTTKRIIVSH